MRALRWIVAALLMVVWASFAVQVWRGEEVMDALFWAAIATACLSGVQLTEPKRRWSCEARGPAPDSPR